MDDDVTNEDIQGKFMIFCIETCKSAKSLNDKQVVALFTQYQVWDNTDLYVTHSDYDFVEYSFRKALSG